MAVVGPQDCLDTLMRRTELHHPSKHAVTIPKTEYDALLESYNEYKSLRAALIGGGVTPETLQVLINTPISSYIQDACFETPSKNLSGKRWSAQAPAFVPNTNCFENHTVRNISAATWRSNPPSTSLSPDSYGFEEDGECSLSSSENEDLIEDRDEKPKRGFQNNHDRRSLVLKGISDRTTLADVAKITLGGQLLNLYIRPHERMAHVSFVHASDAEAFLVYSKRVDIYVLGKRVEVFWDDRQYFLPGHIAHKICRFNATRNLVIRFPKSDITVESIRDDLEHIHRLEVVDITYEGGHIYVSLNNVHNAVVARSCMSSRLKYKGSRIEYYADECAQPLPPLTKRPPKQATSQMPRKAFNTFNRFQMLALDGAQEEDDELELLNRYEGFRRGDWTG